MSTVRFSHEEIVREGKFSPEDMDWIFEQWDRMGQFYVSLEGVDLSLLKHISPIGWENVILYGEYVLNRNLIR